ncbi:MAG: hypothetical protein Ct9H300mP11_32050 [Chloroflexota bacterium]|nr:MAG: hypothetical protein Ct9H300mP11_32050 [Chloroflexota bacterium]
MVQSAGVAMTIAAFRYRAGKALDPLKVVGAGQSRAAIGGLLVRHLIGVLSSSPMSP